MSPEGFALVAEMYANNELNVDAILAHMDRERTAHVREMQRMDAWRESLEAAPLSEEEIDAVLAFLFRKDQQARQEGAV